MSIARKWLVIAAIVLFAGVLGMGVAEAGRGTIPDPGDLPPVCPTLGFDEYARFFWTPGSRLPVTLGDDRFQAMIHAFDDIDWTSTLPVHAVVVKGGGANIYRYDPAATSGEDLTTTLRPNGKHTGVKWIEFCYSEDGTIPGTIPTGMLSIVKTANPVVHNGWAWKISKSADVDEIDLDEGGSMDVNYAVVLTASEFDDDKLGYFVDGAITVMNPDNSRAAIIDSITDDLGGGLTADVDCGVMFPYTLGAGETLSCSYSAALPDGSTRTNTATVTTAANSPIAGGSATAEVNFTGVPPTKGDGCVDVFDGETSLGLACAGDDDDSDMSFNYSMTVGPFDGCGAFTFTNTASFSGASGIAGESSWTVTARVRCDDDGDPDGCTRSKGYWKTHSMYGPAQADPTWSLIGEDTPFYNSGRSWFEVLSMSPKGNVYYKLAAQFVAARLNQEAGADTSAIDAILGEADDLFFNHPAGDTVDKEHHAHWIDLARQLDLWNSGKTGPGMCDDDDDDDDDKGAAAHWITQDDEMMFMPLLGRN